MQFKYVLAVLLKTFRKNVVSYENNFRVKQVNYEVIYKIRGYIGELFKIIIMKMYPYNYFYLTFSISQSIESYYLSKVDNLLESIIGLSLNDCL